MGEGELYNLKSRENHMMNLIPFLKLMDFLSTNLKLLILRELISGLGELLQ